ncbi:hypothetical protein Syun_013924 [Stephania yunnanensis]|uniref:Uncharacterized protein n=1 Tax=Stephania yunnanensis TaxID=152371 RepID=A0AAP0JIJ4_9MAGN
MYVGHKQSLHKFTVFTASGFTTSAALLPPWVDDDDDDAEEPTRKKEIASPSTSGNKISLTPSLSLCLDCQRPGGTVGLGGINRGWGCVVIGGGEGLEVVGAELGGGGGRREEAAAARSGWRRGGGGFGEGGADGGDVGVEEEIRGGGRSGGGGGGGGGCGGAEVVDGGADCGELVQEVASGTGGGVVGLPLDG